jgi:STIP1 homology and U-box containing protein 1
MHDPVVTPSGHSFDRVAILNHLQLSDVDPITRMPMTVESVRPNYALKAACEEFLDKNGWAVDW